MNWRVLAFAVSVLIASSVAGYYFGIPIIVDGEFADRTRVTRYFYRHHKSFESLYQRLQADGHSRILCYADEVRVGADPKGDGEPLRGADLKDYLTLCSGVWAGQGWRVHDGFLFYLSGAGNNSYAYDISLIRYDTDPRDIPDCELTTPSGDWGKCQFELDSSWRLDYEWMSHDYVESFSEASE